MKKDLINSKLKGRLLKALFLTVSVLMIFTRYLSAHIPEPGNRVDLLTEFQTDLTIKDSTRQKSRQNLFKTDSVFSFRTPKGYFPSLFTNISEQASAPFHFKSKQWIIVGASVAVTGILFTVDEPIDDWAKVQKPNYKWVATFSPNISRLGDDIGIYSVLTFGLANAVLKNEKGFQTSLLATQAILTAGIWVRTLKLLTGRERPLETYGINRSENSRWHGPFAMIDQDLKVRLGPASFDSFPSGHTSEAFAIATVFATQYRDIKAVPIISYSIATLVGISRLTEHEHWASDVFVGGLIGYAAGKQVTSAFNKLHGNNLTSVHQKLKNKTELSFIQSGNTFGLSLKW